MDSKDNKTKGNKDPSPIEYIIQELLANVFQKCVIDKQCFIQFI